MSKRLNVAVTGFVGSGSSAVIDLIKEFNNCGVALENDQPYEHIPFYTDNGLFDLGAIMMNVNSPLRSSTAISSFIKSMNWLNNNNFGWFGSYRWLVGDKFEKATNEFVKEISIPISGRAYSNYKKVRFSILKVFLQIAAKIVFKRKIYKWGRLYVYDKEQNYFSIPSSDEFYTAARKFVNSYFDMCAKPNKQLMIYDHLLWPQHTNLVDSYFDENFKMVVVLRDARDLYILNKYYWSKRTVGGGSALFPTNPGDFIDYWSRLMAGTQKGNSKKILFIQFEDLIYNYENSLLKIMDFLDLKAEQHINKKKYFDPDKSIKNTQTFSIRNEWKKEVEVIYEKIPQYTYDFPFENSTSLDELFN